MAVYIDNAENCFGRMKMCHMIADSIQELHSMASQIGMRRLWFQDSRIPHYDLSKSRRIIAIEKGAIEVSQRRLINIAKKTGMEL